jgi:hypothetical protein
LQHNSVKFWEVGVLPTVQVPTDLKSPPSPSASIVSVSLQARDGIAITNDSNGVARVWDILTGLCKATFQTTATHHTQGNSQLIKGRLLYVWCVGNTTINIWDSDKGDLPQQLRLSEVLSVRILAEGSKVFVQSPGGIKVWSLWTGELVGEKKLEDRWKYPDPLCMDDSRIWVRSQDLSTVGWEFGGSDVFSVPLSNTPSERPSLDFIDGISWKTGSCLVRNTVTGEEVFRLSGRYERPCSVQWDGQHLVAGYEGGEVLILDFRHLCS